MASQLQIQGDESVLLRVTHSNMKSFSPEIRFSLQVGFISVQVTTTFAGSAVVLIHEFLLPYFKPYVWVRK